MNVSFDGGFFVGKGLDCTLFVLVFQTWLRFLVVRYDVFSRFVLVY